MPSNANVVPGLVRSRRALYYPYIHPKDVEWVKGTLLAFGQINRVVPDGFPLKDLPEVAFLRDEMGADGEPLLCPISPGWQEIEFAQRRLFEVLEGVEPGKLEARFGRTATHDAFGTKDPFEIHEDKFHGSLLFWLQERALAWRSAVSRQYAGVWWACIQRWARP